MTSVLSSRDGVRDAVTAAASAASAGLPAAPVLDMAVTEVDAAQLVPPGARAVSLNVRGAASGSLVLLLAGSLATAMEDGPLGPQQLVAALEPALHDAGAALERYCGAPLQVEAAHEVAADIALAGLGDGRLFAAVQLRAAGEHVATLALLVDPAGEPTGIPAPRGTDTAAAHDFLPLHGDPSGDREVRPLDLLHDVEMGLTAELGRTRMTVRDLLSLTPGSVVELDRAAGSPVDLLVNGTLIARGEVVVIDEEYGIRISEIIGARVAAPGRR